MKIPKGHVFQPSYQGELFHILYKSKVSKNGDIELVEDGKEDIKEKINSWRDQTDMAYILRQMALGDTSVLNRSPGSYGDFTKMPNTMQEMLQLRIDAERAFYELPLDVRNNFDNDVSRWLATAGSEEWTKKMNFNPEVNVEIKEEVNQDVQGT